MTFTPQEIAEIIAETVEETAKDFDSLLEKLVFVAEVTQEVTKTLGLAKDVSIEPPFQSGRVMTPQHALAWQTCVKLQEKGCKIPLRNPRDVLDS